MVSDWAVFHSNISIYKFLASVDEQWCSNISCVFINNYHIIYTFYFYLCCHLRFLFASFVWLWWRRSLPFLTGCSSLVFLVMVFSARLRRKRAGNDEKMEFCHSKWTMQTIYNFGVNLNDIYFKYLYVRIQTSSMVAAAMLGLCIA